VNCITWVTGHYTPQTALIFRLCKPKRKLATFVSNEVNTTMATETKTLDTMKIPFFWDVTPYSLADVWGSIILWWHPCLGWQNDWWIRKDMEGGGSVITELLLSFCHKETLIRNNGYSSWDSKQTPPKYRSAVLPLHRSAQFCSWLYCQATLCHSPVGSYLHNHCGENLKPHNTNN
jgi:hypothetical protein